MKIRKFLKLALCCLLSTLILFSMLQQIPPPVAHASGMALPSGSYSVMVGQTLTLNWSTPKTLNSAVWTTNSSGNIQIVSSGYFSCTIKGVAASNLTFLVQCNYYYWVTSGTYMYLMQGTEDFYVKVYAPDPTGVSIPVTCTVQVGQSTALTPTVTPTGATATFTWGSSNPAVATVSSGTVTGQDVGTSTITVTTQNGYSDTCLVTVTEPPVVMKSSTPANNSVNADCGAPISVVFPSVLSQGQAFSGIQLTKAADGAAVPGTAAISGSSVVFTPAQRLLNGVAYKLTIPVGAIKSKWGTSNSGAAVISFTTAALEVVSTTPANASMGFDANSPINITFNANISAGTAYGTISLVKSSTGSAVSFTPAISGARLTVMPAAALEYNTKYKLTVPSSALANVNGAAYQLAVVLEFTTDLAPGTFAGGNGTASSPYVITSQAQLGMIRAYPSAYYELGGDIALTGSWTPIGTESAYFTGSLDGKGHSITGLTMSLTSNGYVGLFGKCYNAKLSNLWVKTSAEGVNVIADQVNSVFAGILAGHCYGQMTVENCHTEGKLSFSYKPTSNYGFDPYYGGLAGFVESAVTVTDCSSSADVTISTTGGYDVGGLIGLSRAAISNSRASGQVSASSTTNSTAMDGYAGGLVGNAGGTIYNSVASGEDGKGVAVSSSSGFGYEHLYVGGFVGDSFATITNCSATNSVRLTGTGPTSSGVIRNLYLGGFAGLNEYLVSNSFSTAPVDASIVNNSQTFLKAGGFAGITSTGSSINHCYSTGGAAAFAQATGSYQNATAITAGFIADNSGNISNCYATGSASTKAYASGTGASANGSSAGFISTSHGNVLNCYSTGSPTIALGPAGTPANTGSGFVAYCDGTITGCYYDSTTSKCSNTNYGTPKTTAEMSQASTFSGWDFSTIWAMNATKSPYPTFLWDSSTIKATGITVSAEHGASAIAADKGALALTARVTPSYATNKAVTWSVSNAAVAGIDASGLLTAKSNGAVTARATAKDGSAVYGEITITISNQIRKVDEITVSAAGGATAITTDKGTLQMSAAMRPADATNKNVTWSVDNSAIAGIGSAGLLSAKMDGTIKVRATAKDGSTVYGEIAITVSNQTLRTEDGFIGMAEGNEVTIVGYEGPGGNITVPEEMGGMDVTAIGEGAFSGCQSITGAVFPAGLHEIRSNAFYGCINLAAVTIPDTVTGLYADCFSGTAIANVNIPASVTALESIFGTAYSGTNAYDCDKLVSINVDGSNPNYASLDGVLFNKAMTQLIRYPMGKAETDYTIPEGVVTVGPSAFEGCCLSAVQLPGSLKTIETGAFRGCTQLTDLSLPGSLESIGELAFDSCTKLPSVTIPGSTTDIKGGAFGYCTGLAEIDVAQGNTNYKSLDGVLYTVSGDELVQYPCGKTDAVYTIPNGVTKISPSAFAGTLDNLTEAVISAGVTQIGDFAFTNCNHLERVTIPDSVTEIGQYAYLSCQELKYLSVGSGITKIGTSAFELCGKLGEAYFYSALPAFGSGVFDKTAANICVFYHVSKSASWASFSMYKKQAFCNASINLQDGSAARFITLAVTGSRVSAPASPSRAGYTFAGWYKEAACTNAWNFSAAAITNDIALFAGWAAYAPPAPASVYAASASYSSVKIGWYAASGASGYEIWRASTSTGTYKLAGTSALTYFTDTGLATGSTYYYKVKAYAQAGSIKTYGPWSSFVSAKPVPAAPANVAAAPVSYSSIRVTWPAVAGATGYEVYRATSASGAYSRLTTTSARSYTNTGVNTGTAYYYKVRAYRLVGSTKVYSSYTAVASAKTSLTAPPSPKAAPLSYNSIKISWGAVAGVTRYEVYRSTSVSGTYALLASTTSTSYSNTSVNTGTTYCYKVRAYRLVSSKKIYGAYSAVVSAKTALATPLSAKAARVSSTSIKVTWAAVAGATKYEVWYAASSTGTYALLATAGSTTYTKAGLTMGTAYYFKVRAYRLVGSTKVNSNFSAVVLGKP